MVWAIDIFIFLSIEGMLGYCGSLIHGTRGFGNQIGKHLAIDNYLNFEAIDNESPFLYFILKTKNNFIFIKFRISLMI